MQNGMIQNLTLRVTYFEVLPQIFNIKVFVATVKHF